MRQEGERELAQFSVSISCEPRISLIDVDMKSFTAALLSCLFISGPLLATPSADANADAQPAKVMTMTERAKESLRGVPGVRVFVSDFNNNSVNLGLSMEQLQTDVELRLRQSGIKVFSEKEIKEIVGYPMLTVYLMTMPSSIEGWRRVDIDLRFFQMAVTEIKPKTRVMATTWDSAIFHVAPEKEVVKKIRDNTRDEVDKFCNDFLSVNPK